MKQRAPRKARNMAAKAMRECKLFAPKTIPPRKGKGTIYSRKGRDAKGPPGLYLFVVHQISCCLLLPLMSPTVARAPRSCRTMN